MAREPDELIDIEAAAELAGVQMATIKSWNRKDKILTPVDSLGERGKNRYRRSDVLAAMKLRGIRPPAGSSQGILPSPREDAPSACRDCAATERSLADANARIERLELQVGKYREMAKIALSVI